MCYDVGHNKSRPRGGTIFCNEQGGSGMASHYNPVTPELIAKLKAVAGDKNVRYDEETLTQYQTDEEGTRITSANRKWSCSRKRRNR